MEEHRTGEPRARAWENLTADALANYAAPQQYGHSVAFEPVGFDPQGVSRNTLVVEAGEAEGIVLAEFDLDAVRAVRAREVWGAAVRRPRMYGALTDPAIASPFVRVDGEGRRWPPQPPGQ